MSRVEPTRVANAEMRSARNMVRHGIYLALYGVIKYLAFPFSDTLRWAVTRPFAPNIKTKRIADGVTLWFPWNLTVGQNSTINQGCIIDAYGGVEIGRDVRIASYVRINTADHEFEDPGTPIRSQGFRVAPVRIGNDVWLGSGVIISPGVEIGDGCVIGAGSVVTDDISPYSVAVGVPSRVIRRRSLGHD